MHYEMLKDMKNKNKAGNGVMITGGGDQWVMISYTNARKGLREEVALGEKPEGGE